MYSQSFNHIQKALAGTLKDLGEKVDQEIKGQLGEIREQLGTDSQPFLLYIATAGQWGADVTQREAFTKTAYNILADGTRDKDVILNRLKTEGGSGRNIVVSRNLLVFWGDVLDHIGSVDPQTTDWVQLQTEVERIARRSKHWMVHAPFKIGVVDRVIPPREELKVPIGNRVLEALKKMGLLFKTPLAQRDIKLIQEFALFWAKIAETNHFVIDSAFWQLGKHP